MFGLFKRKQQPPDDGEWTIWSADPTRTGLRLIRRWGMIYNTGVSNHQFNVYEGGTGFVVTVHSRDGREVERDDKTLFRGGACASIADAWKAATSCTSDMLYVSGMGGLPCQQAFFFDTTPGQETFHLATLEYVSGAVRNTCHFDPDTRQPLASPVPPSQLGELHASRQHNAALLSKVLDAAVYRMKSCPLAADLLAEFPARDAAFEAAKLRYVIFVSWCARRATMVLSHAHRDFAMILGMMDGLIEQQFERLCPGDKKALELIAQDFGAFDDALDNPQKAWPSASKSTAAAFSLNMTATSFIFGGLGGDLPNEGDFEKWAKRSVLPGQVLIEIQADATRIMAGLR